MDIKDLKEGMEIKNYRKLCELLGIPVNTGKSKQLQMKDLKRYFKSHKEGQKIIIDEIFGTPEDKVDNRGNKVGIESNSWKDYNQFKISYEERNNIGIYYILKDNDIYIGSTIDGFRNRFQAHYYGYDELMQHTYELLQNGGEFYILHDTTDINDEVLIRQVENEYIQYFINYTDFNVINKKEKAYSLTERITQDIIKKEKSPKHIRIKYKTLKVKIQENQYEQAIQCLIENGFIEEISEDNKILNNDTIQEMKFSMDNIPF